MSDVTAAEPDALAEIYHRYGRCVYQHARRLTAPSAAAQITVAVFITLCTEPQRFVGMESLRDALLRETRRRLSATFDAPASRPGLESAAGSGGQDCRPGDSVD